MLPLDVLDWLVWLFAPIGVVVVPVALLIVRVTRRRRRAEQDQLVAVAQLGWSWVAPSPWMLHVAEEVFTRGRPVSMAAGPYRGRDGCLLDYQYTTSSGDSLQTVECHLVAIFLPVALPPLVLSGQHRLVQLVAGSDLELENQAFNDRFRIDCFDDRYASSVLHPRVMELMLAVDWFDWRISGNALVSWANDRWTPPGAFARLDLLARIADLIPNFVQRDYGRTAY